MPLGVTRVPARIRAIVGFWARIRYQRQLFGIGDLLWTLLQALTRSPRLSRAHSQYRAQVFDRRFGVETATEVPVDALDIDAEQKSHAVEYSPSQGLDLCLTLDALQRNWREFTFVDYGSGKGRTLLIAAMFHFQAILGVELSYDLCRTARSNVTRCAQALGSAGSIKVQNLDARKFAPPRGPLVLYAFNPFDDTVLAKVLANIHASLVQSPRPVFIIYVNPQHRQILDECDWLSQREMPSWTDRHGSCIVYEARLIPTSRSVPE